MVLVRPRLTDYHGIMIGQEALDFAIPFLDDDIPLYVDPFLLWKSPSMQDTSLHTAMLASFNGIGQLSKGQSKLEARKILVALSECPEAGLGHAQNKKGRRISEGKAEEILALFRTIPDITSQGLQHIETIQLLIEGIGKDRISDFACSLLKSFLIDFTIDQCIKIGIPRVLVQIYDIYDPMQRCLNSEKVELPVNPETNLPLLLIPKRWLRFTPWINYDNYFDNACIKLPINVGPDKSERVKVLDFNRQNYDLVKQFITAKERTSVDCKTDPLFKQLPVSSVNKKWSIIEKLPTGKTNNADKKFENVIEQLFASLFYPQLDFAQSQSRTDSGVLIRDLIFYNNKSIDFLEEIYKKFECTQIVFEIKNTKEIERDHVNQLNRYLNDNFGRFGVFVTRNPLPKHIEKNLIDLWSGQRKCIVCLSDNDIRTMVTIFESKQRNPIEVLKRAYIEFTRKCPS